MPPGSLHTAELTPALVAELARRGSVWTTWLPGTAVTVTALLLLLTTVWHHTRRRRSGRPPRRWRTAGAALGVVSLSLLATAAFANAYAGYLPTTAALAQAVGLPVTLGAGSGPVGAVSEVDVPAPGLGIPRGQTLVYTPPGYRASAGIRYPVLYLIHGSPGRAQDWFLAGGAASVLDHLIRARVIPPLLAVAPSANAGFFGDTECLDAVGGRQMETYLTSTVPRYVESHYPTAPGWQNRSIGGMSSGGFCALNLALRHQDLFASVLAFEPYGDPGPEALRTLLHGDLARYLANSPRFYLPRLRLRHPLRFFVDVGGASGRSIASVRALARELERRHQPVAFRVELGQGHTWTEAAAGLPYGLAFVYRSAPAPGPAADSRTVGASAGRTSLPAVGTGALPAV